MNGIARLLRIGAFCALASLATAGAATIINFDDQSSGTVLSNEYVGLGATFQGSFTVSDETFSGVLTVPSPPNYAALSGTVSTLRFNVPGKPGSTATTNSVSVTVPSLSVNGGCYGSFVMDAFDAKDNFIGTLSVPGVGLEGAPQKTYTLSRTGIASVNFTNGQQACVVPFDNLTYDVGSLAVPALGPVAMALLALVLALGAFVALRRRA